MSCLWVALGPPPKASGPVSHSTQSSEEHGVDGALPWVEGHVGSPARTPTVQGQESQRAGQGSAAGPSLNNVCFFELW